MTREPEYEHIIIGAGLSGILLARRLLSGVVARRGDRPSILVVDPALAGHRRATFAFWSRQPTPLDAWTLRTWRELTVVGADGHQHRARLDGWHYRAISWQAARADFMHRLGRDPRVRLWEQSVDQVHDGQRGACVRVGDRWIRGSWVYDSRPPETGQIPARRSSPATTLHQTFRGIWVEASRCSVDPTAATLFDFSARTGPDLGFSYVLPVSDRSAMVMAVRMAAGTEQPDPLLAVPRVLGGCDYRVVSEEHGVTDLVSPPPVRREGMRILAVGRRGGRARPSTGYAVTRILADSDAVAGSLFRYGHPFAIPPDSRRDRLLDAIWLYALAEQGAELEPAFLAMFTRVPIEVTLRFLDGAASPIDVARIVARLPQGHLLRAAAQLTAAQLVRAG